MLKAKGKHINQCKTINTFLMSLSGEQIIATMISCWMTMSEYVPAEDKVFFFNSQLQYIPEANLLVGIYPGGYSYPFTTGGETDKKCPFRNG